MCVRTGVHRYDLGVMVDHRTTLNIRTARKLFTCHAAETREPAEGETAFVYVSDSMQKQMSKHHSSDCQQLFKILMIN